MKLANCCFQVLFLRVSILKWKMCLNGIMGSSKVSHRKLITVKIADIFKRWNLVQLKKSVPGWESESMSFSPHLANFTGDLWKITFSEPFFFFFFEMVVPMAAKTPFPSIPL